MKIIVKSILVTLCAVSLISCDKNNKGNEDDGTGITVTTTQVSDITAFSAVSGGSITGSGSLSERGLCWGTSSEPTVEDNVILDIDPVVGEYSLQMSGLVPETSYYVRAYVETAEGEVIYGNAVPFTTANVELEEESNSYLVMPASVIAIPVSRANKSIAGAQIGDSDELTAELLWMDNIGVVENVSVYGQGSEGAVIVYAGTTDGNALVAVKVNGEIKWSWHVWVSQNANSIGTVEMPSGAKLMDRNLGATTKTISEIGAVGLQYQWGRKDPFTASADFGVPTEVVKYDLAGGNPEVKLIEGPQTFAYTVQNPDTYITTNYCDWCDQNLTTWWADETGNKTVYDPCPEGWRMPSIDAYAGLADEHFDLTTEGGHTLIYNDQSNYFPYTGYREVTGAMDATANYGTFWVNAVIDGASGEASALSPSYGTGGTAAVNGAPRGRALSIRCLQE